MIIGLWILVSRVNSITIIIINSISPCVTLSVFNITAHGYIFIYILYQIYFVQNVLYFFLLLYKQATFKTITYTILQGSRVWPNFSRVRLKKIWGCTSATSCSRKKKSLWLKVSLWFNNRHTLGSYRGINQSEIVKGGPPLWLAVVQIFMYVCVRLEMRHVYCCSQTEREVSSRDAHSVANLDLVTNLATSWTNISESLWSLVLPQRREISVHAALSLHLLCSVSIWEEQHFQLKEILLLL